MPTSAAVLHDNYHAALAEMTRSAQPEWLRTVRRAAFDRFETLSIPTVHQEDWRYTNLAPLTATAFAQAREEAAKAAIEAFVVELLPDLDAVRLVFVNGYFVPSLSRIGSLPRGLTVRSLRDVLRDDAPWIEDRLEPIDVHGLWALNSALFQDGLYVETEDGVTVEQPVLAVFLAAAGAVPQFVATRNLIRVAAGSELTLMECYSSLGEGASFTNAVTDLVVGQGAVARRYKVQMEGSSSYHFGGLISRQHQGSECSNLVAAIGASLMRDEIRASLLGEGGNLELDGLHLASGNQVLDTHSLIEHVQAHCTSHELYKGVLDGQARSVFRGRIHVWPGAQKTDAIQQNPNLLLSDKASVYSKPQLEIYADDVRCTHGATIGHLDDEMLFYLRSRGIAPARARELLTFGFASDLLDRVRVVPLRGHLEQAVLDWLQGDGKA